MGSNHEAGREVAVKAFAGDPVAVYAFVDAFFEAFAASGVEHICISPGSRSTPLAVSAERAPGLRTWIGLDERASAFFALGLAKASSRPVALVCTSGTAAANYLPAVVEAHYARVPLIVLSSDRPPELRDWGAGQTIEQTGLYGRYPRWTAEVPIPDRGEGGLRFAMQLAARSAAESMGRRRGPVHLNWPFREPLAPAPSSEASQQVGLSDRMGRVAPKFSRGDAQALGGDVSELVSLVRGTECGVICCGPMPLNERLSAALRDFSRRSGWPILAGPASQLRDARGSEPVLSMGDGFLRAPEFAGKHCPDAVIRMGETPVSKAQKLWIEASEPKEIWWLDEEEHWGEPSHRATRVISGGAASLLEGATQELEGDADCADRSATRWLQDFVAADEQAARALEEEIVATRATGAMSSVSAVRTISRALADQDALFVSNSMSIRVLDLVHRADGGKPEVFCSRGASGIDGINSTALGIAAARGGRSLLLTGDLAFLHDLSGLLITKREAIDLVIVVLDDDGGGIFSFLPVAEQGEGVDFERLFGTPHGLDLEKVAALFEFAYTRATTEASVEFAIGEGFSRGGVQLVHVPLDRSENENRFRETLARIVARVDAESGR